LICCPGGIKQAAGYPFYITTPGHKKKFIFFFVPSPPFPSCLPVLVFLVKNKAVDEVTDYPVAVALLRLNFFFTAEAP